MEYSQDFFVFNNLIKDQFSYGGKKYSSDLKNKEATDCLFDAFGYKWLIGTMSKYCYRFNNLQRERDLLKIATYCYILWLKRGYHLDSEGTQSVQNTTVEIKDQFYTDFVTMLSKFELFNAFEDPSVFSDERLGFVNEVFETWAAYNDFNKIKAVEIYTVYYLIYCIWSIKYSKNPGSDKDTWNEAQK